MSESLNGLALAFKVAADFPNRIPLPIELMDRYGMSQSTSYRWVQAMRAGRYATT
jgi:hypothetical protein